MKIQSLVKNSIVTRLDPTRHKKVRKEHVFIIMSRAWPEDGVWNASAYDLPVAVCGNTIEEALQNFDEAIQVHFLGLHELGKVKSTIKHLQDLAERRGFYRERLLEQQQGSRRELSYPLQLTESSVLCGANA